MNLTSQRRLAAKVLNAGVNRVWIDPDESDRVKSAITTEEIRILVKEGRIGLRTKRGISRGRVRVVRRKKAGSRKGGRGFGKTEWVSRIRAVRKRLRTLRDRRQLSPEGYRLMIGMAKGGAFRSVSHVEEYANSRQLLRKR